MNKLGTFSVSRRAFGLGILASTACLHLSSAAAIAADMASPGAIRTYYIAAEEVDWNYAPDGREMMMGMNMDMGHGFSPSQEVFVKAGPSRIGSTYHKAIYVGYLDADFTIKDTSADPSNGLLGPVIRAEVGDRIVVNFRNTTHFPVSVHPHGVFYKKDSEGAMTSDGTSGADKADDRVPPGGTHIYTWDVPERAGPGPEDPSSIVWLYHSHVDEIRDTNSGLVGPIVITRHGEADADGKPLDVDREAFSLFTVMNENESLFLGEMIDKLEVKPDDEDDEFEESNLMHSINGFVYGNMPMPTFKLGDRIRWYVMTLGTEVDLHTPHWHGNTVLVGGHRKDVVELLPATTVTADMVADNPGIWMYHCHVNDHIAAGMTGRYQVLER